MLPRPAWRNTRNPASVVASIRRNATPSPRIAATRIKAAISASGSNRMAMMIHFTMSAFLARFRPRARLARRRGSSMVDLRQLAGRVDRSASLWLQSRSYIIALERAWRAARIGLAVDPPGSPRPTAASGACETCSISTPSSSWRWRCSFSSACAACWASAPAVSGRPTIPIPPRRAPSGPRPGDKVVALPGRAPDTAQKTGRTGRAGRSLEGYRRARLGAGHRARRHRARGQELRRQELPDRRPRGLRHDRDGLCGGRPQAAQEPAGQRGL